MNRFTKALVAARDAFWPQRSMRASRSYSQEPTDGSGDTIENVRLRVYRGLNRAYLETIYANFWSAARIIDTKVDDAFGAGIVWSEEEDEGTMRLIEELKRLDIMSEVPRAVKSGRLFGTSLIILAPADGDFESELDIDMMREGDISHIIIADRFKLEELIAYGDPTQPNFGKPHTYRWTFNQVSGTMIDPEMSSGRSYIDIHESRCIRFDGIKPLTTDGWDVAGSERWGISIIARALDDIIQDATLAGALPDIAKRACVPIIKKQNWTEALSRGDGVVYAGEVSPDQLVRNIADNLATAKLMIIDAEDDTASLDVTTTGLNDIAQTSTHRLAMIDGIPITRFTGESASGLSATGDGEARDWRIAVEDYRSEYINPRFKRLLDILSRNVGLAETPEWEWGQLGDATFDEKVDVTEKLAKTAVSLVNSNIWDEEEAREFVNNSELSNVEPTDIPEIDETFMEAAKMKLNPPKAKTSGN